MKVNEIVAHFLLLLVCWIERNGSLWVVRGENRESERRRRRQHVHFLFSGRRVVGWIGCPLNPFLFFYIVSGYYLFLSFHRRRKVWQCFAMQRNLKVSLSVSFEGILFFFFHYYFSVKSTCCLSLLFNFDKVSLVLASSSFGPGIPSSPQLPPELLGNLSCLAKRGFCIDDEWSK